MDGRMSELVFKFSLGTNLYDIGPLAGSQLRHILADIGVPEVLFLFHVCCSVSRLGRLGSKTEVKFRPV